mmetsp:Transcript_13890/g.21018  ORF Transcript_13890/g.21018 Transcript_13890/m.21018 type:complete len:135 (+) Transcript_13890:930-1334(+)
MKKLMKTKKRQKKKINDILEKYKGLLKEIEYKKGVYLTPLYVAVILKDIKLVKKILKLDRTILSMRGITPLYAAASNGDEEIVIELISYGSPNVNRHYHHFKPIDIVKVKEERETNEEKKKAYGHIRAILSLLK